MISVATKKTKATPLRVHYAVRLVRSVRLMGETAWQPLCNISDTSKITLTTIVKHITCLNCRNLLTKNRRRMGLSRQVNKILREGAWYEPDA